MIMVRTAAALLLLSGIAACDRRDVTANDFWKRVSALCGNAYEGRLVSDDEADAFFETRRLVMHVRDCSKDEIRIPFHVGDDDSRTWVLTRAEEGVMLRHDHAHIPNTPEPLGAYGGVQADDSTGTRMTFPADDASKAIFDEAFLSESNDNIWAIEVRPSARVVAYEMARPDRFFRLEFDTSKPVPVPAPGDDAAG